MALPFVRSTTLSGMLSPAAATNPITIPATVAGDAVVIDFGSYDPTNNIASIVLGSETFVPGSQSNSTRNAEIWVALNVAGGLTALTVNLNATGTGSAGFTVYVVGNIAPTGAVVGATANTNPSSATPSIAAVTPTAGRDCIVFGAFRLPSAFSSGPDNSFTGDNGGGASWSAYRVIAAASGSYSSTITCTSASRWDVAGLALLAPASGAADNPPPASSARSPGLAALAAMAGTLLFAPPSPVRIAPLIPAVVASADNPPVRGPLSVASGATIRATWADPREGAVQRRAQIAPLTLTYGQQPPRIGTFARVNQFVAQAAWPDPREGAVQRRPLIPPLTLTYGQQPPVTGPLTPSEQAAIRANWPELLVAPSAQRIPRSAAWDPGVVAPVSRVPSSRAGDVALTQWGAPPPLPPRAPRVAAIASAAIFVQRQVSIAASSYYGTDAGTFTYQVFLPSQAAIAAYGWSGLPYRVLVAMHGSGEQGSDGVAQMLGGGSMGQKLGWSTTPDQTWPTIVVFPQTPSGWTGTGGPDAGARARRMALQLITATLNATLAEFNCDARRCFLTGLSYGAQVAFDYCYQYPNVFAALIPAAGDMDRTVVEDTPGLSGPFTEAQAAAEIGPFVRNIPTRTFNSAGDLTITAAKYQPTIDEYTALAPCKDVVNTVYGSGDHGTVWTTAYADAGNTLWPWMFAQQLAAADAPPARSLAVPLAISAGALLDPPRQPARTSAATLPQGTSAPIPTGGLSVAELLTLRGAWPDPRAIDRLPIAPRIAPLTLAIGDAPVPTSGLSVAEMHLVRSSWPDARAIDAVPVASRIAPLTLVYGEQPTPDDALSANELTAIGAWSTPAATPQLPGKSAAWNVAIVVAAGPGGDPARRIQNGVAIAQWVTASALPPRASGTAAWNAPAAAPSSQPAPRVPRVELAAWTETRPSPPLRAIAPLVVSQPAILASPAPVAILAAWQSDASVQRAARIAPLAGSIDSPPLLRGRGALETLAWAASLVNIPARRASAAWDVPALVVDVPPPVRLPAYFYATLDAWRHDEAALLANDRALIAAVRGTSVQCLSPTRVALGPCRTTVALSLSATRALLSPSYATVALGPSATRVTLPPSATSVTLTE
jgi:hypothetical protein